MSVENGRREYRLKHSSPAHDEARRADLTAKPGTVANGRLLYRAGHGDEDSRTVVQARARRGDELAQSTLANDDSGIGLTGGATPASDNLEFGDDAA